MNSKQEYVVVKFGGSLLFKADGKMDLDIIKSLSNVLKKIHSKNLRVVMVVGGGKLARNYINVAKSFGSNQSFCDLLGIKIAQINALTIHSAFDQNEILPIIPESIEEAAELVKLHPKILIMGGVTPGQSTDAVAALMAEILNARILVRATDLDGIYTANPDIDSKAKFLSEIHIDDLLKMIRQAEQTAGGYALLDLVAANVIHRSKIKTVFLNGKKPENISQIVLSNKTNIGTIIKH
ncbi:MAG: UMP kinase [Candidatus Ranarchaeia archaeon]